MGLFILLCWHQNYCSLPYLFKGIQVTSGWFFICFHYFILGLFILRYLGFIYSTMHLFIPSLIIIILFMILCLLLLLLLLLLLCNYLFT